jgi:hypothetical protein
MKPQIKAFQHKFTKPKIFDRRSSWREKDARSPTTLLEKGVPEPKERHHVPETEIVTSQGQGSRVAFSGQETTSGRDSRFAEFGFFDV